MYFPEVRDIELVEKIMVTFGNEAIHWGTDLVKILDEKLPLWGALWILQEESEAWRFWIVTPRVDSVGPKRVYEIVQKCLKRVSRPALIGMGDVIVTSDKDPLAALIANMIRTGPAPGISGIRFTGNYVNGVFVKDAYIYRLDMSGQSNTSAEDSEKVVVPYRGFEIVLRIRKTKQKKWHAFVFVERRQPDWHSSGSYDARPTATREGAVKEGVLAGEAAIDKLLGPEV